MASVKIDTNGSKFYYANDGINLNREDGPAAIYKNGSLYWFMNGQAGDNDGLWAKNSNGVFEWNTQVSGIGKASFDYPNGLKVWWDVSGRMIWPKLK